MKKLMTALSFACVGALAFADNAQWNTTAWITGIGANATAVDALDVTGGAWTIDAGSAAFDADTKTLSIETESEVKFTVATESAATAMTAQKLTLKGVFTPCAASDLLAGSAMNEKGAQLGFAVVSGDTAKYYAWVGETTKSTVEGATAIADWVELGPCANVEAATELTVTLSYWGKASEFKADFSIKNGDSVVTLNEGASPLSVTSTAATSAKVGEIACTGSGTLSQLDGVAGVPVAQITIGDEPVYFPTLDEAIANAGSATVKILADVNGDVTIDSGKNVSIDENGKSAGNIVNNGTVTFPLTADEDGKGNTTVTRSVGTISGNGTIAATTTDDSKECIVGEPADGKVSITVQTKKEILEAVQFEETNLLANETNLRKWLTDNEITAYTGAKSTTEAIQTALAEDGSNGLKKWQSYALGIKPTTKISLGYATAEQAAEATDALVLALKPSDETEKIANSGDFDITYSCTDPNKEVSTVKTLDLVTLTPVTPGIHSVKMVFSKKAAQTQN